MEVRTLFSNTVWKLADELGNGGKVGTEFNAERFKSAARLYGSHWAHSEKATRPDTGHLVYPIRGTKQLYHSTWLLKVYKYRVRGFAF